MKLQTRHIFSAGIISLMALVICACTEGSGGYSAGRRYDGTNASLSQEEVVKQVIVRDVLGGALTTAVDPIKISYDSIEARAISINAAYETTTSEVNESYIFQGADGLDSLSITATGEVDEVTTSETDSSILDFSPLNLLVHFENFIFTNTCGLQATITGDIECRVNGKYTRGNEHFKGSATCISGTFLDTQDIKYSMEGNDHDIHFVVNAIIDGNAFVLESYKFSGSFFVDNRFIPAGVAVGENLSCNPEDYQ